MDFAIRAPKVKKTVFSDQLSVEAELEEVVRAMVVPTSQNRDVGHPDSAPFGELL
jgi:hypothetical protein